MRRSDRYLFAAGALAIAVYFFRLTRPSLHAYFSPDDSMNLYRAWTGTNASLIKANFLFFTASPFIRPFAAVWYRAIFHFAGFNPAPFHAVNLAILAIDIFLTYALARRLSGSREAGAVAALLGCYYTRLGCLYFDTGYVFDVLCYAFYFGAFLLYVRVRQEKRSLRVWEVAACAVLYICALNSKEMAVTLPLFLAIYELLYHGRKEARVMGVLVTGVLTLIFAIGRSLGSESLLHNAAYQPLFTWSRFMETSGHFLGDMTDRAGWPASAVLLLWGVLFAVAWSSRSRVLKFAWLFLMLSPIPVAFVLPRGAAQYYLPWFGWVLYISVVLVRALEWVTRRIWGDRAAVARLRGAVVMATLILVLYPYYKHKGWWNVVSITVEAPVYRDVVSQLHTLAPNIQANSRLLFLNDPIKADVQDLLFLVRLSYRDDSLVIDRIKQMKTKPDERQMTAYNFIFDYQDGRFVMLKQPGS